MHALSIIFYS